MAYSGMGGKSGFFYLLTLTAPGDSAHKLPSGQACPCTPPGGVDLAVWNAQHSSAFNLFMTRLKQRYPDVKYHRGIEVQRRGALHDHLIVRSAVGLSLVELRRLAMECGFGHSVDLQVVDPRSRKAAGYVAKYVSKSSDARDGVPWAGSEIWNEETGELVGWGRATYRTWSGSLAWGDSMRAIRSRAAAYAQMIAQREEVTALESAVAACVSVLGASVFDSPAIPPPIPS